MLKKIIFASAITLVSANALFAYDSVDCSTNPAFGQYGCNECFNG
jgi:hypothetical protein